MSSVIGLIGTKIGMTHVFDAEGNSVPVTVIQAGPCPVVQVKKTETDGYVALQVGYESIAKHKLNKPEQGHFKKAGVAPTRRLSEFRVASAEEFEVGKELTVAQFQAGDTINVTGRPIGKGFMGSIKRWHFGRGPMSHGSKSHRLHGSIGAGTTPSRVYKGLKMAGRKPNRQSTVKNLRIVGVDAERNLLLVRGATPGSTGAVLKITPTGKAKG
ncbi:MAG: 50S ribosomal protein L3 [Candidatus Sericytochromatia bacterium]